LQFISLMIIKWRQKASTVWEPLLSVNRGELQSNFFSFFQKCSVCCMWTADNTFLFVCPCAVHSPQTAHLTLSFLLRGEMGGTGRTFVISLFRANHSCVSHDSYFLCMLCPSVVAGFVVNCGTLPQSLSVLRYVPNDCMGRDSSVGIATRYGLDGPGRTKFFVHVQAFPGAHHAVKAIPGLFPMGVGSKAAEAWRRPPTTSSTEVKESV